MIAERNSMPKRGECGFWKSMPAREATYARNKPFSDAHCSRLLIDLGAVIGLLPQPPGRLLDLGCGTGWTSCFFAKRGFEVLGQDISADAIYQAHCNKAAYNVENLEFVVGDYEDVWFDDEF